MTIDNALASVAVKDIQKAAKWYEKVLGRRPISRRCPRWRSGSFPGGGGLQVYQLAERAGSGSLTLPVSRIDDEIAKLERLDIDTRQRTTNPKVKTVMVTDPDGNHIAFAEAHEPKMLGGDKKADAPAQGATGTLEHLHFPARAPPTARRAMRCSTRRWRCAGRSSAWPRSGARLPPGGPVAQDYVFEGLGADGNPVPIKLSELFAPGKDTLALYSFMYGPERKRPCPGCTHFLDSLDGASRHAPQRLNLYIVAKSPLARLLAWARERGWHHSCSSRPRATPTTRTTTAIR
jgi:catechol 2,3-dioxygenase-like lactoylglutathione lyase family enzyme